MLSSKRTKSSVSSPVPAAVEADGGGGGFTTPGVLTSPAKIDKLSAEIRQRAVIKRRMGVPPVELTIETRENITSDASFLL